MHRFSSFLPHASSFVGRNLGHYVSTNLPPCGTLLATVLFGFGHCVSSLTWRTNLPPCGTLLATVFCGFLWHVVDAPVFMFFLRMRLHLSARFWARMKRDMSKRHGSNQQQPGKAAKVDPTAAAGEVVPRGLSPDHTCHPKHAIYLQEVSAAMDKILNLWPDIASRPALPLGGADKDSPGGFLAPFDPAVYDARMAAGDMTMDYLCGINLFWVNAMMSATSHVPVTRARVFEFAASLVAGSPLDPELVVHASFASGHDLPRGGLVRVSAEEPHHGLLFRVADRISNGADQAELQQWLRVLLSVPCCFKRLGAQRLGSEDAAFAEAISFRNRKNNVAKAVEHTAHQLIYNVAGFRARKQAGGLTFGAAQIAKIWAEEIVAATGGETLHKKSTVDACLTVHDRLLSIEVCAEIADTAAERRGGNTCLEFHLQAGGVDTPLSDPGIARVWHEHVGGQDSCQDHF